MPNKRNKQHFVNQLMAKSSEFSESELYNKTITQLLELIYTPTEDEDPIEDEDPSYLVWMGCSKLT